MKSGVEPSPNRDTDLKWSGALLTFRVCKEISPLQYSSKWKKREKERRHSRKLIWEISPAHLWLVWLGGDGMYGSQFYWSVRWKCYRSNVRSSFLLIREVEMLGNLWLKPHLVYNLSFPWPVITRNHNYIGFECRTAEFLPWGSNQTSDFRHLCLKISLLMCF